MEQEINKLVEIFAYFMLFMGLMVSITRTIHRMIRYYQYQCVGLTFITIFTAWELREGRIDIVSGLFVFIPILMALFIRPLLAQATVMENVPVRQRLRRWFGWLFGPKTSQPTLQDWLKSRRVRQGILSILGMDVIIVALAFVTIYTLARLGMDSINPLVLAVSFSLLLLGLSTMVSAEDMISQVMGLFVMEQGMFLAALRGLPSSQMRSVFILGLFLYIIITHTMLVILLPELHQKSGSLDIDQQTQLKG